MNILKSNRPEFSTQKPRSELLQSVRAACSRLAPLWPLQDYVAVNPFTGMTSRPFHEVCKLIARQLPGGAQMPGDYYLQLIENGALSTNELTIAIANLQGTLPAGTAGVLAHWRPETVLEQLRQWNRKPEDLILTVAEAVDQRFGTHWADRFVESLAHFCAAYYDEGQSAWQSPWKQRGLFAAWIEFASRDASLELEGLHGFRDWVRQLPVHAELALAHLLPAFQIQDNLQDLLHKELLTIRGWAGYIQYTVRSQHSRGENDDSLTQLLAMRVALDSALLAQHDHAEFREFWPTPSASESPQSLALLVCQTAQENRWHQSLKARLLTGPQSTSLNSSDSNTPQPAVQAVFCIDVRSEIFRRALEAVSPSVETIGFAGFFGLPVEVVPFGEQRAVAQCPVLLQPKYRLHEVPADASPSGRKRAERRKKLGKRLTFAWDSFKHSASSCFSFVETAGLFFGASLLQRSLALGGDSHGSWSIYRPDLDPEGESIGLGLEERVALGRGTLRNLGLTEHFARLVLLCGHGSATTNNPYAAGLDCGACGGHAGDLNARIGAAILNDPQVRKALREEGIGIPEETWFVAGIHNTTTDEVTLFDPHQAPPSHRKDWEHLEGWLKLAGKWTRRERAHRLAIPSDKTGPGLDEAIFERSRDWSQIRPEWGLAGNAAFIAAPRSRTKQIDLGGRAFLHNYDFRKDKDNSVLELIMCAPMVVANWINLQYYASTVNNSAFGSGDKTIHNVVGQFGVCLGNGGDLQTGLPLQSLHNGEHWVHEPIRLHVYIEAPRERIEAVLQKHPAVRELVENLWLLLFAIESDPLMVFSRHSKGGWTTG